MAKVKDVNLRKLVIVRTAKDGPAVFQSLATDFRDFVDQTAPLPIRIKPIMWPLESPESHVGLVLTGLRLKSLMALKEWEDAAKIATVLSIANDGDGRDTEANIDFALAEVGLHIHPLAD